MLKQFLEDMQPKNRLKKLIYFHIQANGETSKTELKQHFKVTQTTLSRILDSLVEDRLVFMSGTGIAAGGRPPLLYRVTPSAGYYIGVELSRTHVTVILVNASFNILAEVSFPMDGACTPEKTMTKIIGKIEELKNEFIGDSDLIAGIGIGSVGPIDRKRGIILSPEGFQAAGWENVPVTFLLSEALGIPVYLSNGADTAGLAEYHLGDYRDEKILYMISGYGIRGSYIQNGFTGNVNAGDASALGHITIERNGRRCVCGNRGCLLAYTSIGSIIDEIHKIFPEIDVHHANDLIPLINEGHREIRRIALGSAELYGTGLANMVNILHPDAVILHGKLIYQCDSYFEKVKETIELSIYQKDRPLTIKRGNLGEQAAAVGAAIDVLYRLVK